MNLKKAKAYRQLTRMMVQEGTIKPGPWASYTSKSHAVPAGTSTQVLLDPKSPKGMYRRLKREGVEQVFRSL